MKSVSLKRINEFWFRFSELSGPLARDVTDAALLARLDGQVRELNPRLSWEIGPGLTKAWQFVISPNLDRSLRHETQEIISYAPELRDWEFHSARKPKDWNYMVRLQTPDESYVTIDASGWSFVLLRYPDVTYEVLLKNPATSNLSSLSAEQRWQAAAITLESILGEDAILDKIDKFELVDRLEPQFESSARPIQELRQAFGLTE